ncbi:MAG: response regulator [Pseudomonadota bacterium]
MANGKTILIVDDEAMVRRLLASTLKRAGFSVAQASNGVQAWEWLETQTPDALITDIDMPRMTGEELCVRICERDPERTYPIFVVTSKTAIEHRRWSRNMHNVSFIEKPMSMRKLVEQLKAALAGCAETSSRRTGAESG